MSPDLLSWLGDQRPALVADEEAAAPCELTVGRGRNFQASDGRGKREYKTPPYEQTEETGKTEPCAYPDHTGPLNTCPWPDREQGGWRWLALLVLGVCLLDGRTESRTPADTPLLVAGLVQLGLGRWGVPESAGPSSSAQVIARRAPAHHSRPALPTDGGACCVPVG